MRRIVVFCSMVCAALCAVAMPTKKEVAAARDVVAELMSDVVADQKAGKLTAAQVAEKALELAGRAETEAAKLLLIQGAVMGFARGGEPARAAEAMQRMKREIKDITPEYEADVLSRAVKTVPAKSGRLLYAMLDDTKRLVRYRRDIPVLEKKLAKMDTPEIRAQLAERLAATGDWKRALELFAKMDGDVARAAKFERGEIPAMTASEVADIWWVQKGMKDSDGFTVFQRHAGEWYKKALADSSLKGLKRDLAEKRLAGMGDDAQAAARSASAPYRGGDSGGPRPVAGDGNATAPQSGERPKDLVFKLDSKTDLEMVGIPAGKFTMGYEGWERSEFVSEMCKPHEVTITRPFWAAKYPVTYADFIALRLDSQKERGFLSFAKNQGHLSDEETQTIAFIVKSETVDEFFSLLNKRIRNRPKGYVFRLPTMAEWEYCFKADGSDTDLLGTWVKKDYILSDAVKDFQRKTGLPTTFVPVKVFKPNPWGLCKVFSREGDWILDTVNVADVLKGKEGNKAGESARVFSGVKGVVLPSEDPVFVASSSRPSVRLSRGYMYFPTGIIIGAGHPASGSCSFRIVLGPDLIAEQAKRK